MIGRLNKLDGRVRDISHRFLGFLEDRLAPLTLMVLVVVITLSILFWDSWRGEESGSTAIRNLVLVMAAIAALPLAIWRSKVAERQAKTAQRGLLNERYQKGAEMLGSQVLAVRLGGIYALARLAREHPGDYHTQIMSLLCAFVRNPPVLENQDTYRREDVQAVMTEVGSRSASQIETEKKGYFPLDFSGADLKGVNFVDAALKHWDRRSGKLPPANMENAFLSGTNLSSSNLTGANLKGAFLCWANLKDALLIHTNLSGADLKDCKGLTQKQIDMAIARPPDNPADLEGVVDAETGKPLVWRGASPSG